MTHTGNTANPEMNSQNHVMLLGDLMIWYYENMAGIKSSAKYPGFKQIIMKPDFEAGLSFVNASFESNYGTIKSHWKKTKSKLEWEITIPANTTALVYLPTTTASKVKINKNRLDKTSVRYKTEESEVVLELKSGTYSVQVN